MALISLTRLRLATVRSLPGFAWHTVRAIVQARRSPGFCGLRLLGDRRLVFWTATAWDDLASMKAFRAAGAHKAAMPRLASWCDEASVTRWVGPASSLGDWAAAHACMVEAGEASPVHKPSPGHLAHRWAAPRLRPPLAIAVSAAKPRG